MAGGDGGDGGGLIALYEFFRQLYLRLPLSPGLRYRIGHLRRRWMRRGLATIQVDAADVLAMPAAAQTSAGIEALAARSFDCVIEPAQVVKLASQATGLITRLDVDRGDAVAKGQVLGTLSDEVERANLALAKS